MRCRPLQIANLPKTTGENIRLLKGDTPRKPGAIQPICLVVTSSRRKVYAYEGEHAKVPDSLLVNIDLAEIMLAATSS